MEVSHTGAAASGALGSGGLPHSVLTTRLKFSPSASDISYEGVITLCFASHKKVNGMIKDTTEGEIVRTSGLGINFTHTSNSLLKSPSKSAPVEQSAYISRRTKAANEQNKNRSELLRDLDRQKKAVSVHSYDNAGLSAEELHKRQVNAKRQQNSFKATTGDKAEGFLKLTQAKAKTDESKIKKHLEYNYRDISSMIRQAKTSSSAGQAAIKAKRIVLKLRRDMSSASDNDEKTEISAALNHAKSMERTAKKKKHHLETEELIESTIKQDEESEALSGKTSSTGGAATASMNDLVSQAEDVVADAYEELDEKELAALEEAYGEFFENDPEMENFSLEEISSDMLSGLDDMMEDFDEAYEMLDEVMENLDMLEAVDPHMDEDGLKKLRIRHRNSEEKEMTKADMEYLKTMFEKYQQDMQKAKAGAAAAMTAGMPAISGFGYNTGMTAVEAAGMPTVDVVV